MKSEEPPKLPRPGRLPREMLRKDILPNLDNRRDSNGSLDDNDRELLNRVLVTAKQAIEGSKADREQMQRAIESEARERASLEGKMVSRFSDYDVSIANLKEDVGELKGLRGDIGGLRGDISGLTAAVTSNLAEDARRERDHGALVIRVDAIANEVGREAGKKSGGRWGFVSGLSGPLAIGFLVWLISAIVAVARGKDLPPMIPVLAPAATQPAPQTSAR